MLHPKDKTAVDTRRETRGAIAQVDVPPEESPKLTFHSTLFLRPIVDRLLTKVPSGWREDLRLGLQEALVNASIHGNSLNPDKRVTVRYGCNCGEYWWEITDEGDGFQPPTIVLCQEECLPECEAESGRGLFLLYNIFDRVFWNENGTGVRLCKSI
jgi:serine/threonine-protein kinase RsbW